MKKVALIQMNSNSDIEENLFNAQSLIYQAAQAGAQMVVLPENFSQMPVTEKQRLDVAEENGSGPIQNFIASQAKTNKLWIIAGSISLRSPEPEKVYSSCLVYDNQGSRRARYDKQHLFDVDLTNGETYKESSHIAHGAKAQVVKTPLGHIGLSICYDLRFPEYFRLLVKQGAEIICVPSAFTYTTGEAHWKTLLRARAIENQVYILAPGQTGTHDNGRRTFGHSQVFDPWGEQLAVLEADTGVIYAEIDLTHLNRIRSQIPCLQHRRY